MGKKIYKYVLKSFHTLFRHSNDFFLTLNYTPHFIKLTSKIMTLQFDELGFGFFFAIAIISHVLICTHENFALDFQGARFHDLGLQDPSHLHLLRSVRSHLLALLSRRRIPSPPNLCIFKFIKTFALYFMMGKANNAWETFPKCVAGLSYHLMPQAPYFRNNLGNLMQGLHNTLVCHTLTHFQIKFFSLKIFFQTSASCHLSTFPFLFF